MLWNEANGCLMMHQGRACLLLSGRRYSCGDADYTRCYKFIQVSVITMLGGGTLAVVAPGVTPTGGHRSPTGGLR